MKGLSSLTYQRKNEIFGFLLIVLALFVGLSLVTHALGDDEWIAAGRDQVWVEDYRPRNLAGTVGALLSSGLFEWFGQSAFMLAVLIGAMGAGRFLPSHPRRPVRWSAGGLMWLFTLGIVFDLPDASQHVAWIGGASTLSGWLGRLVAEWLGEMLGVAGGMLVLGSLLLGAVMWILPWKKLKPLWARRAHKRSRKSTALPTPSFASRLAALWGRMIARVAAWRAERRQRKAARVPVVAQVQPEPSNGEPPSNLTLPDWLTYEKPEDEPSVAQAENAEPALVSSHGRPVVRLSGNNDYQYPSLGLLVEAGSPSRRRLDSHAAGLLARALQTFNVGIDGPIEAYPGPVITRYEFRPAPGVKVNQIVTLADDLALALSASRVRVVAPVPGKSVVGIEVPNRDPETVHISRILGSNEFVESNYALPIALGDTIDGLPFIVDLASMPHLLIAGATGSGKSMSINVIITSLLFRHHPNDVRLLFIDPKRLELSVYTGIPHMERPVVSHPRTAERLLSDATREMDERYRALASRGVRNVADYNRQAGPDEQLPYIIIVVDELADLMMSQQAARIELLITRLAQMARAVGIHLILATQRPSVDVITGLIKANFSCRIGFQMASKVDSRTILDVNGAEKLLGKGDMLFLSPGRSEPTRIHGAYISSGETAALVEFLRAQTVEPEALPSFSATADDAETGDADDGDPRSDPLFIEAAELVIRHQQGSVSLLQRRLGIGYQRAARLIDRLEEAGVVGPYDGSRARTVLWTMDQFEEKFARPVG